MKTATIKFQLLAATILFIVCSSTFAKAQETVTYYVFGVVYDANDKTSYYTNIFPVQLDDDDAWHTSAQANRATAALKYQFKSYIYQRTKSSYLTESAYYFAKRSDAINSRNAKMDTDVAGGRDAPTMHYFSFYFDKDE